MILHILTDDKFTDYAIQQFSAPEMQSEFLLLPCNQAMNLVSLKQKCTIMNPYSEELEQYIEHFDQYTGIVFHGMFWAYWQRLILRRIPKSVKVAWVFWGGEIYSRQDEYMKYLAPLTKFVYNARNFFKRQEQDTVNQIDLESFRMVDICLTDEREEYEYACRYVGKQYEYLWYNYYSLEETISSLLTERCNGNNILIGNSSNAKNNHFDILWKVWRNRKQLRNPDRKLIVPLSYGDQWVCGVIAPLGKKIFGDRMRALESFMSRDEYNALLLSCSTMILGYTQPAGQGNIITGLWLGMRVYLSEKSMTYQYFKRIGCVVYSMESDLKKYGYAPMDEKDVEQNREVLKEWYSKENMHKRNLEIVKALS